MAAYVAIAVLTRLVALRADILNVDEASYIVGAWEMLHGHLPYTAFADNKPPLIYAYYAMTQVLAGHGIFAVRLVTMVITVPLTAFAASAFYHHDRRGVLAAVAFLVYSAAYDAGNMLAVNCEIVMLLPLAWSLVVLRDGAPGDGPRSAFLAGGLVGIGTLVKYQAAFWLPALALSLGLAWWRLDRRKTGVVLAALSLGFLVPIFAMTSLFAVLGGLEGFLYWNVAHNIGYLMNPTTVAEAFSRALFRLSAFVATTLVLWIGVVRSRQLRSSPGAPLLIEALVVTSFVAVTAGWRFFPHYFIQFYLPLAIGAAPWLAGVVRSPLRLTGASVVAYSTAALVGFTAWNVYHQQTSPSPANTLSRHVADRLRADPCFAEGSLFVWGSNPTLYYHAGLPLASRFFFPEFPLVAYTAGNRTATARHQKARVRDRRRRHWRWLMADLSRSQPTYIIDTAPARVSMWEYFPLPDYPWLERFVQRRYDRLDVVDEVQIYRRRDCAKTLFATAAR